MRIENTETGRCAHKRPDVAASHLARLAKLLLLTLFSSLLVVAPSAEAQNATNECSATAFSDVPAGAWFADAVDWAACHGITHGTSATMFSPDAPVTRAQMATFLWRFAGKPEAGPHPFTDVASNTWFSDPVRWLYETGITRGTSATTFSPSAPVTRAQMATFLWRLADKPLAPESGFADVPGNTYYSTAVGWMWDSGITTGTSATTYGPDETLTRAQAVTFLWRFDAIAKFTYPTPEWESGSYLRLESDSDFHIRATWCCLAWEDINYYQLTVRKNNETPVTLPAVQRNFSSWTFGEVGFSITPANTYTVTIQPKYFGRTEGGDTLTATMYHAGGGWKVTPTNTIPGPPSEPPIIDVESPQRPSTPAPDVPPAAHSTNPGFVELPEAPGSSGGSWNCAAADIAVKQGSSGTYAAWVGGPAGYTRFISTFWQELPALEQIVATPEGRNNYVSSNLNTMAMDLQAEADFRLRVEAIDAQNRSLGFCEVHFRTRPSTSLPEPTPTPASCLTGRHEPATMVTNTVNVWIDLECETNHAPETIRLSNIAVDRRNPDLCREDLTNDILFDMDLALSWDGDRVFFDAMTLYEQLGPVANLFVAGGEEFTMLRSAGRVEIRSFVTAVPLRDTMNARFGINSTIGRKIDLRDTELPEICVAHVQLFITKPS